MSTLRSAKCSLFVTTLLLAVLSGQVGCQEAASKDDVADQPLAVEPVQVDTHLDAVEVGDVVETEKGEESEAATMEPGPTPKLPFTHGFVASLSMIIVSEIGDKTFFIAAIMAMQHSKLMVCAGAIISLALMHTLSVLLGFATIVIPRWITFYLGALLFAIFGGKMLWEGWHMSREEESEEFDEVSEELKIKEQCSDPPQESSLPAVSGAERGELVSQAPLRRRFWLLRLLPPVFFQAFTLTFVAEWGDRSQIAAIILAARENPYGVLLGGVLGHILCTGMAVIGGTLIAKKISVRTVTLIGGVVFLIFAVTALFQDPNVSMEV